MNDREKLLKLILESDDICEATDCVCGDNCKYSKCTWCRHEMTADHLLANGVNIQRWIPVEERLPEDDVEVLTRRATGMSVESRCGFGWVYDEYNGRWEVTHWTPLPQPPIEEQNRAREENG